MWALVCKQQDSHSIYTQAVDAQHVGLYRTVIVYPYQLGTGWQSLYAVLSYSYS